LAGSVFITYSYYIFVEIRVATVINDKRFVMLAAVIVLFSIGSMLDAYAQVQPGSATLKVIKQVINDNGGTAVAGDFTITVTGDNVQPSASFPGAAGPAGTVVTLNPGAYSVGETLVSGYAQTSASAGCSGTISLGEFKTCKITNNDIPTRLKVIKQVINDNGGTAVAGDFTITVTGDNVQPSASFPGAAGPAGTVVTLNPGAYSVGETLVSGYAQTSDDVDCSGTISLGEFKTCKIVNDDIPPTRTIGFWSTHLDLASDSWLAIPPGDRVIGTKDMGNGPDADDVSEMMGGFWSNIAKDSNDDQRSDLDKARMSLLQQLIGAMLNFYTLGTDDGGLIADGLAAFAGSDIDAINAAHDALDEFNNSGDAAPLGFDPGSADPQTAQDTANTVFWDILP